MIIKTAFEFLKQNNDVRENRLSYNTIHEFGYLARVLVPITKQEHNS